jgi:hypothetical protein
VYSSINLVDALIFRPAYSFVVGIGLHSDGEGNSTNQGVPERHGPRFRCLPVVAHTLLSGRLTHTKDDRATTKLNPYCGNVLLPQLSCTGWISVLSGINQSGIRDELVNVTAKE